MMRITTYDAVRMAAAITGITTENIRGRSRTKRCVHARAAIAILMKRRGRSLAGIGSALNRDHTSILSLLEHFSERQEVLDLADLIEAAIAVNPPWHQRASQIMEAAYAGPSA